MTTRVSVGGLSVAAELHQFVAAELLPGTGIDSDRFWHGTEGILAALSVRNRDLLQRRADLQSAIDNYHIERRCSEFEPDDYERFLHAIGYLVEEPSDFEIGTTGVDAEVATQAGPQLVVPILNARFAVNAANARWGSLYDALYGTDAIVDSGPLARGDTYNAVRGAEVIARAKEVLDQIAPIEGYSHADATDYRVDSDGLVVWVDESSARLASPDQFVGYRGPLDAPTAILFVHNSLHLEVQVDREHPVGATDPAGVKDVLVEAALSTIMDLEDSVAATDVDDKIRGYRNWLQLMQGTLSATVTKGDATFVRYLNSDRTCTSVDGEEVRLRGRSLMFVRHVGLLMTTDAVLDSDGHAMPEGILDALVTAVASLHDLRRTGALTNSPAGAMYVVKPKLHGPEEVAFTDDLLSMVEELLDLPVCTIKVGIMDEERRTSVNLKACLNAARDRVAFINTGFLDRTGDEIHTSMQAGPMVRKADMRSQVWMQAYEESNVDLGLACGLGGRAQIGKGMWAAPDSMAAMLEQKIAHPMSGASCAWVPSPTAAVLHALHYHQVDVRQRQRDLQGRLRRTREELLRIPLADRADWSGEELQVELDNNVQGVLGYVVRWVDSGVGCSKVPDIHGEQLMEDRATCRISSQHVANWLMHDVVTVDQVEATLRRMAVVVDEQNAADPGYMAMAPAYSGQAFLAARDLLLAGAEQPSGYTELILSERREAAKALHRKAN